MDTKKTKLIGNILKLLIAVPGFIMFIMIILNEKESVIDASIMLAYVAFIACAVIALVAGIIHFVGNIGKSKGMLLGIVGFIVILIIGYSMAQGNLTPKWEAAGITEQVSKLSGAGIYAVLIMLVVAVGAAVFSEISNVIKG